MATALDVLEGILQQLSPGDNPFLIARGALRQRIYPVFATSTLYQLYFLSAVFSFAGLCTIVTFYLRWRQGASLALYRLLPTSRGNFICPQTTNTLTLFTGCFAFIVQGYIWSTVHVNRDHGSHINYLLWKGLVWLPLWIAVIAETWAVAITNSMSSSQRGIRTGLFSVASSISPALLNIFFVSINIAFIAAIVTTFVISNDTWNRAFRTYEHLDDMLTEMSANFNGTVVLTDFAPLEPFVVSFLDRVDTTVHTFQIGFIFWAIGAGGACAIYVPIALVYVKTLRDQIQAFKMRMTSHVSYVNTTGIPSMTSAPTPTRVSKDSRQQASLSLAYANLMWTCTAVITCTLCYFVLSFVFKITWTRKWHLIWMVETRTWIAADTLNILQKSVPNQAETLGSLYIYGVFGLTSNVLTLLRAFDITSTHHKMTSQSGPSASNEEVSRKNSTMNILSPLDNIQLSGASVRTPESTAHQSLVTKDEVHFTYVGGAHFKEFASNRESMDSSPPPFAYNKTERSPQPVLRWDSPKGSTNR